MEMSKLGWMFINLTEELICVLISFPMLGKIRRGKKWIFLIATIFLVLWTSLKTIMYNMDLGEYGNILTLMFQDVGMLINLTLFGAALEGGVIRVIFVILIQDVSITAVTSAVTACLAFVLGKTYSQILADTSYSINPVVTLSKLIIFMFIMFLMRKSLRRFRETAIEKYPVFQLVAVVFMTVSISPAFYQLAVPGIATSKGNNIVLMMSLVLVLLFFMYYHILSREIYLQNLLLIQQNQLFKENIVASREQIALTRKLRHDIRRHLNVLKWANENIEQDLMKTQKTAYTKELEDMYQLLQTGTYIGEADVDALLFSLEQYCKKRGIFCDIRLRQITLSSLPENIRLDLFTAIIYSLIQYCEAVAHCGNSEVQIIGGVVAGINQIKALVTVHPEKKENLGKNKTLVWQLKINMKKQINDILRDETGEVIVEKSNDLDLCIKVQI